MAFIHRGELLRVDTPENLRRIIPGRMVEIVCDDPRRAIDLLNAHGGYERSQVFGDRIKVVTGDGGADPITGIERILAAGGLHVTSWRFVKPALEDVFIYLMEDAPVL